MKITLINRSEIFVSLIGGVSQPGNTGNPFNQGEIAMKNKQYVTEIITVYLPIN